MEPLLPKSRLKHIKEQCFQTLFLYIQSLCWWKTALDDALWYDLCISSQNAQCLLEPKSGDAGEEFL